MSIKAMNWVWKLEDLSAQETLVLLALADQANDQGYCYPSRATLAQKARCSVRTVGRSVKNFEEWGLLRVAQRNTMAGRISSEYFLNIGAIVDKDFSLQDNPRDKLSSGVGNETCVPVDNFDFPGEITQGTNCPLGVAQGTPEVTPEDASAPWLHIKNLNEPNSLSFPNDLDAREKVSSKERLGGSDPLSATGEDDAPPGVSETLSADDLAVVADRVQVESLKSSPKDSNIATPNSTPVPNAVVSDKSSGFHTDPADLNEEKVDWDLLGCVLPRWMFKALNDDVARQSTALVKGALGRSWTVEDLREVFTSNPKPVAMSSPAGLVLSRVKRTCAQPAPALLEPSEGFTEASGDGFRDVDRELKRLRSWMDSVGWSRNRGFPYPKRSIVSVDEVLAASNDAELPDEGTREILRSRLLTVRSLLARESGGAL